MPEIFSFSFSNIPQKRALFRTLIRCNTIKPNYESQINRFVRKENMSVLQGSSIFSFPGTGLSNGN